MKVPVYDEFQVRDRALTGGQQSSIASPSLFSAGASRQSDVGKGLLVAGGAAVDIAGKMQDRENVDMLFRAETALTEELIAFQSGVRERKGAAAKGVTQEAETWFGETASRHGGALANDTQRRLFGERASRLRLQTLDAVSRHEATERDRSALESSEARRVTAVNRAVASAHDWSVLEAEKTEMSKTIAVDAALRGWTPEIVEAKKGEWQTRLHKEMLQQLAKDPKTRGLAKTYYDKYEKEIDGAARAELGEFAKKATDTDTGTTTAGVVWEQLRPRSAKDPILLSDMEDKLRVDLKGNPEALDIAVKDLRSRVAAFKDQRKEQSNALEAGVNSLVLEGASSQAIRRSAAFIDLAAKDPEAARKIDSYLENKDYMRVVRANASEEREDRVLGRKNLDLALKLSDPDKLLAIKDRNEIVNMVSVLGRTNTAALLSKYDALKKDSNKLIEARIDKQDFDTIALTAGFRPNEKAKSEEEKDALVRLQARVENVIDQEQRGRGNKPLSREEKQKIMQREIDNTVMVGRTSWFADKRPVGVLTPEEKARVRVPEGFRTEAMAARKRNGLETNEEMLRSLWLNLPPEKRGGYK